MVYPENHTPLSSGAGHWGHFPLLTFPFGWAEGDLCTLPLDTKAAAQHILHFVTTAAVILSKTCSLQL